MAAANTDYFVEVGNPGSATTLTAPGHSIAGTTFNVVSTSNWPTTTGVIFAIDNYTLQTVNGVPNTPVRTPGTYTEWEGTVVSGTQITNGVLRYGTDQNYSAGSLTRVYIPVASSKENRLSQGIRVQHNQDGTHGAVTATSVTASGTITAASFVQTGGGSSDGWTVGIATPNTVTYNGNRSYNLVMNATDLTSTLSPGMRLKTTRTVTAPTQSTSLNGTTQYYSKTTPAGMTFTDDFVVSAWVKMSTYAAATQMIVSRFNTTSGWALYVSANGQVNLAGWNAGNANFSQVTSYQSLPVGKWVHVTAQLDMSAFTATTTTSYIMFDGVDVPAFVTRGGTNPVALVQAGNLEIGSNNGGALPFGGKIAQVAIYNSKVTQANIRATISQGLSGSETSLISAYSFNNSINDLNTGNANNLTANGSAVATNADSPFSVNSFGTATGTTDYGIITQATFSTNTTLVVQVPEGNTIPTSGGVSAVSYSTQKSPYGMPIDKNKWKIVHPHKVSDQITSNATYGSFVSGGWSMTVPIGAWEVGVRANGVFANTTTIVNYSFSPTVLTGLTNTTYSDISFRSVASSASSYTFAVYASAQQSLATATTYVMYTIGSTTGGIDGSTTYNETFAEFNLL